MAILSILAALGAAISWAIGTMLAHKPAKHLGAFAFTRTQLVSSAAVLVAAVALTHGWSSVNWRYWPAFLTSSLIGVVGGNLALAGCLRRGGPRRAQLLATASVPMTAGLGWLLLGETVSLQELIGMMVAVGGIVLAIAYGANRGHAQDVLDGSLLPVIFLGLASAAAQAIGLVAMKPALLAGAEPLVASALRTGGAAVSVVLISLWPAKLFEPVAAPTPNVVFWAIVPGILGYVVAVSLVLFALSHGSAGVAAAVASIAPVIMLPLIWMTTKTAPSLPAWIGAALVIGGIGLMAT